MLVARQAQRGRAVCRGEHAEAGPVQVITYYGDDTCFVICYEDSLRRHLGACSDLRRRLVLRGSACPFARRSGPATARATPARPEEAEQQPEQGHETKQG